MRTSARLVLTGTVVSAALGIAGPALAVDSPYSGYSGKHVDVIRDDRDAAKTLGGGSASTGTDSAGTTSSPATLPFTGGELVLAGALGGAAVATGAALVVGARRRPAV